MKMILSNTNFIACVHGGAAHYQRKRGVSLGDTTHTYTRRRNGRKLCFGRWRRIATHAEQFRLIRVDEIRHRAE